MSALDISVRGRITGARPATPIPVIGGESSSVAPSAFDPLSVFPELDESVASDFSSSSVFLLQLCKRPKLLK